MKTRAIATLALSAALLLGTTGCSMISTQATTIPYSPSDGVNVPASGPVLVRNAMFVVNEEGSIANFAAALINESSQAQTLTLELDGGESTTVKVPANSVVTLGVDEDPLTFESFGGIAGSTKGVYFQSGEAEGAQLQIPVLDGALPYYADLVPSK